MAPSTRSGGAPPQDRVYHHTPAKQQSHFPSRRTTVRVYSNKASRHTKDQERGKGNADEEKDDSESSRKRRLKQATLTQIDFVPRSTADAVVEMSDSEEEKKQAGVDDKENQHRHHDIWAVPEDSDEQDAPIPSGRKRRVRPFHGTADGKNKRRRTLGDERDKAVKAKPKRDQRRRKTLGDDPNTPEEKKGVYHTQTLTQLLGQRSFIKDSDDEGEESDGFEKWLNVAGEASPPQNDTLLPQPSSPQGYRRNKPLKSAMKNRSSSPAKTDREGSVVLQTPAKKIHFEVPSSSQLSTPCTAMMGRYGPIGAEAEVTPSKKGVTKETAGVMNLAGRKAMPDKIVIADSYDTESWGSRSTNGTQAGRVPLGRLGTPNEEDEGDDGAVLKVHTPTKALQRADGAMTENELTRPSPNKIRFPSKKPLARTRSGQSEIPDSDDEGGFDYDDEGQVRRSQEGYIAGADTQMVMAELANVNSDVLLPLEHRPFNTRTESVEDQDGRGKENVPPPSTRSSPGRGSDEQAATDTFKTPRINRALAPPDSHGGQDGSPHNARPTPDSKSQATGTPSTTVFIPPSWPLIRQPLHLPSETDIFTQPMESQRVHASILQSLPQPGGRTDVVIPISHNDLQLLIRGYTTTLETPSAVLTSVRRFWLFENETLRYVALADAELGELFPSGSDASKGHIDYPVEQVYELNNVLTGKDLREEGLIPMGEMRRHKYLPPAVVSRYLWNLRHAIFLDIDEQLQARSAHLINSSVRDKADQGPTASDQIIQSSPPQQHDKPKVPTPSMSDSQQIENQLQSESTHYHGSDEILVPSTPDDEMAGQTTRGHSKHQTSMLTADSETKTRGSVFGYQKINQATCGRKQAPFPRPSQATTASQLSSPSQPPPAAERRSTVDLTLPEAARARCPSKAAESSSVDREFPGEEEPDTPKAGPPDSSVRFVTYQDSLITLPESIQLGSSQAPGLLNKSQMLPDSLLRDEDYAGPM